MKTFATDSCQWDTYGPGLKLEKKTKPELLIIILLKYCFSVFPHYDTVKFSESYNSIIITEMRLNLPNQGKPSASVNQQSSTGISELKLHYQEFGWKSKEERECSYVRREAWKLKIIKNTVKSHSYFNVEEPPWQSGEWWVLSGGLWYWKIDT